MGELRGAAREGGAAMQNAQSSTKYSLSADWKAKFKPTIKGCPTRPSTLRSVRVCSTWLRFTMELLCSTFIA